MKILLLNLFFQNYTGSEMYAYELGRELVKLGHEVYVTGLAKFGDPMVSRAESVGMKPIAADNAFEVEFDIVHTSQYEPTKSAILCFSCPVIQTVHSEVDYLWRYERPCSGAAMYIAIRPAIFGRVADEVGEEKVSLVYNPIDFERFALRSVPHGRKRVLFAGTLDSLRREAALHTIKVCEYFGWDLWFVGSGEPYTQESETVRYFPAIEKIEDMLAECDVTAGILLGRTTLEGFAMDKPAIVYRIDGAGNLLSAEFLLPPENKSLFDSRKVAKQVESIYGEVLK